MPGKPIKMAREVEVIEWASYEVSYWVFQLIPETHRLEPMDNPLSEAWYEANQAVMRASIRLTRLADILRERAGIPVPGPVDRQNPEYSAKPEPPPAELMREEHHCGEAMSWFHRDTGKFISPPGKHPAVPDDG